MIEAPSPNHDARPPGRPPDMLIVHYTGMTDGPAALARLREPAAKVSAHYLVEEDGRTFALVDEGRRAWHAGAACWAGDDAINDISIGVEIVNPGHEFGYRDFPVPQIAAAIALCQDIVARQPIPPNRVLGHGDVAPARKRDPGERFPWPELAAAGIGLWPAKGAEDTDGQDDGGALAAFGYDVAGAGLAACVTAFQRHWRPERVDGAMDPQCRARLAALLADGKSGHER